VTGQSLEGKAGTQIQTKATERPAWWHWSSSKPDFIRPFERRIRWIEEHTPAGPVYVEIWPPRCLLNEKLFWSSRFQPSEPPVLEPIAYYQIECLKRHGRKSPGKRRQDGNLSNRVIKKFKCIFPTAHSQHSRYDSLPDPLSPQAPLSQSSTPVPAHSSEPTPDGEEPIFAVGVGVGRIYFVL